MYICRTLVEGAALPGQNRDRAYFHDIQASGLADERFMARVLQPPIGENHHPAIPSTTSIPPEISVLDDSRDRSTFFSVDIRP